MLDITIFINNYVLLSNVHFTMHLKVVSISMVDILSKRPEKKNKNVDANDMIMFQL